MSAARCGRGRSSLALGPHPQRELTLTPRRGFPCPRLGVAAGALHWRWGPTTVFLSRRGPPPPPLCRCRCPRNGPPAAPTSPSTPPPVPHSCGRRWRGAVSRRGVTRPVGEHGRRRESRD